MTKTSFYFLLLHKKKKNDWELGKERREEEVDYIDPFSSKEQIGRVAASSRMKNVMKNEFAVCCCLLLLCRGLNSSMLKTRHKQKKQTRGFVSLFLLCIYS